MKKLSDETKKILKRREIRGIVFFAITFFSMCSLKLWFTMFLVFSFSMALSFFTKKNSYCDGYCPIGMMQDNFKQKKKASIKYRTLLYFVFVTLFWVSVMLSIILFQNDTYMLWSSMLKIMIGNMFLAIFLHTLLGKRFYCVNLCPIKNPYLNFFMKLRRKNKT